MLDILGTVFLVLIGLVVAISLWAFIKVKIGLAKHARVTAIEESMHMPKIVLEPNEHPSFVQPETVGELLEQAVELGAMSCGNYDAPVANVRVCAYCLETPPVYIAIYDHDQIEPWTDVVLRLDQDRSFTLSTVPEIGRGAPRPPEYEMVHFASGTKIAVLVQEAAERASKETTLPAPPDAFKDYFEEAAQKSQEFIETQAISQDWLATIANDAGVELDGDEAEHINVMRQSQQVAQTELDCFDSLAESGDFTAAQWNQMRDDLVAVWDDLSGQYVSGIFYSNVDIPDEFESDIEALEDGHGRARERVAAMNAKLPKDKRLVLIGRVSAPVEADIYRGESLIV